MTMAELLGQNTALIHELSRAALGRDWAGVDGAAFKLAQHNNVMLVALHEHSALPPVVEPEYEPAIDTKP